MTGAVMGLMCELCGFEAKTASGLALHVRAKHPPQRDGDVFAATVKAIAAAGHLTDMDAGAVAVLLDLARTIDGMDMRDADAPLDNVTIPTFLKFSTELALTPLSRLKLPKKGDQGGSKLAQLRSIEGGRRGA